MRVHVTDAKPGDCLKTDTYNANGVPVMVKGTVLAHDDISKLIQHHIDYIDIEPGQQVVAGDFGPDHPASPELLRPLIPLFDNALEGIENLFLEAAASSRINDQQVDEMLTPLISELGNQKDVVSLLLMLDGGDEYTYNHSLQVGVLSYYLAKWLGHSDQEAYVTGKAGYLHDIGKCMISKAILNKPGKLTEDEFREMKKHTQYGYELIKNSTGDELSATIALQHHERESGSGYPYGLTKDEIHPYSKIVAVADVYSAMTSHRVYQNKQELLSVLRELYEMSFGELNGEATQAFIRHMLPNFINKRVLLNSGQMGIIVLNNPIDYFRPLVKLDTNEFVDLSVKRQLAIEEVYL
ncbi:HD-GYP domain-containing protein [Paenibacillus massiliensis]|uniref:HD-GYP domain-containing protein n=1 Tax=Paenibacillus massiliensis TaxID=225917 RepID=UPI00047546CB|nr:HD-GYP domain-containing protein [Paenibacillus massiliensis]